jgi:hypothetical protein
MCGPSSAAISASDSGPRELAMRTSVFALAKMPANVLPTRPDPTMLYFIPMFHLAAYVIYPLLSARIAAADAA